MENTLIAAGFPIVKKILVAAILSLSILVALDVLIIDNAVNTDEATDHTDNALYVERAQALLDGKLLYRDVETKTPPLINYLLVPPVLFGGSSLAFEVYFSLFIVLTVASLYHFLSSIHRRYAFITALSFLLIPTTLATPTLCRQDESIVVFFFILPLLLLYAGKRKEIYSMLAAAGVWMKMHPVFLIPPFLLRQRGRELVRHLLIMAGTSLAIILPFLALAFSEFTWYLKFYLLGEGEELQGISVWRILDSQGITVPGVVLIGILGVVLAGIYLWQYKKSLWRCILLSMIAYFIIYPKIHYEYFLMLFVVATPYFIARRKYVILLYAISALTGITLVIEQRYLDWQTAHYAPGAMVGAALLCMLAVDVLLIYLARACCMHKSWLDDVAPDEYPVAAGT